MKSATAAAARSRPAGITLLALLFLAGAIVCVATIGALRFPDGPLGPMWALNPRAQEVFARMGSGAYVLMTVVSLACALSAAGVWAGQCWGRALAIGLLSINLVGDLVNAIVWRDARTLIGLPIAGALILYLLRNQGVRRFFENRGAEAR